MKDKNIQKYFNDLKLKLIKEINEFHESNINLMKEQNNNNINLFKELKKQTDQNGKKY